MKNNRIVVLMTFFLLCIGCSSKLSKDDNGKMAQKDTGAYLQFATDNCDFGEINMKSDLTKDIKFCNNGDSILVIHKIDVSCSCVKVIFPQKPINPNEEGCITIALNPKGQKGYIHKKIYIQSNAKNNVEVIYIKANIVN